MRIFEEKIAAKGRKRGDAGCGKRDEGWGMRKEERG